MVASSTFLRKFFMNNIKAFFVFVLRISAIPVKFVVNRLHVIAHAFEKVVDDWEVEKRAAR